MSSELDHCWDTLGVAFRYLGWVFHENPENGPIAGDMLRDAVEGWVLDNRNEHTRLGLALLRDCLKVWDPDTPDLLMADFNRLFVGPGPLLVPPWESVHRGAGRFLFDHYTLAVRQFYARFKLEIPSRGREPEDHLGFEFMFMAHLCDLGLEASRSEDLEGSTTLLAAQREFLASHLATWVPGCLELIQQHSRTLYYRGLAHLAQGCLDQAVDSF